MRFLLSCLLISVLCAGCVLRSGQKNDSLDGLGNSYEMRELAESTAAEIQRRYSPAQTTLVLHRAPGSFGERLEQALRNNGFAVMEPGTPGTEVSYTADVLEDGAPPMGYVQVRLPDGQFFSFTKELTAPLWPTVNPEPVPAAPALAENTLDAPMGIPAAPSAGAASAPVIAPASGVSQNASEPLPPHKVRATAKAAVVAKRNKVAVADFCRWNDVMSDETLPTGRRVYLAAPPTPRSVPPVPAAQRAAVHVPVSAPVSVPASTAPASASVVPTPTPVPAPVSIPAPVAITPPASQQAATPSVPEQPVTAPLPVENIHEYEPAPVAETWNIQPGGLRIQIHGWAARAGYQLVWKAANDFDMEASANFEGEFLKAVETLFAGMQRAGYALRVTVHQGNKVLEVTEG